jgi:hypothetical protein
MEKTAMQELLEYIKSANTFTFLPEQLAKTIEDKYLYIEEVQIRQAFDDGEINVWNGKRDESFEFEGGINYFEKTYIKNNYGK